MHYVIIIGSILSTLIGWSITYEPFGKISDVNYWYIYDNAKSIPLFLGFILPFLRKPNNRERKLLLLLCIYFGINAVADVFGVNEKGNWFTYMSGALFIYIIFALLTPKRWAFYLKSLIGMEKP